MATGRDVAIAAKHNTRLVVYYTAIAVASVLVIAWALPRAWEFVGLAPGEFWVIAGLALLAETQPFMVSRAPGWQARTALSICFCFAIFVLWGAAPAVLVQIAAVGIAALRRRLSILQWLSRTCRLVCALASAEVVVALAGRPTLTFGSRFDRYDALHVLPAVLAWLAVNFGLLATVRMISGLGGIRAQLVGLRYDVIAAGGLLLLAPIMVTAPTAISIALLAVPLIALLQLAQRVADQEQRLSRDSVTGVLSLRGLVTTFERLTARDHLTPHRALGLLVIKLDGLGYVSRSFGRPMADRVAASAARQMATSGKQTEIGRIGGDVFVLLMPGLTEPDALATSTWFIDVLTPPVEVDGLPFALGATVGVALSPKDGRDFDGLLVNAELAMEEARQLGEPVGLSVQQALAKTAQRADLLTDLRSAIHDPARRGELAVLYQPQIEVDSGQVVGVEALLRWTHPQRGRVSTAELIHAVEPSEVMQLLTWRVIDDVVAQLSEWRATGLDIRAAVNVSARDLHDESFERRLASVLADHAVEPTRLKIEITERTLLAGSAHLVQAIRNITATGVGLSLDDFGTGYSSLQQLRRFPLTEIKIDGSYVSRISSDEADRALVRAIHQLAQAFDLSVVAEGVETAETVAALAELPGIIAQGWYFGHPMAPNELLEWNRQRARRAG